MYSSNFIFFKFSLIRSNFQDTYNHFNNLYFSQDLVNVFIILVVHLSWGREPYLPDYHYKSSAKFGAWHGNYFSVYWMKNLLSNQASRSSPCHLQAYMNNTSVKYFAGHHLYSYKHCIKKKKKVDVTRSNKNAYKFQNSAITIGSASYIFQRTIK